MDKNIKEGGAVGKILANVLVTCGVACVCATIIALTARFILWLF